MKIQIEDKSSAIINESSHTNDNLLEKGEGGERKINSYKEMQKISEKIQQVNL